MSRVEVAESVHASPAPKLTWHTLHQLLHLPIRSGPLVGVMKVKGDEEALGLMNDSPYGLTASIWTNDKEAFERLLPEVESGTVFMNRCDYLDPALAWTGVKESGRGVSLSAFGYDQLTRAKSVHVKVVQ